MWGLKDKDVDIWRVVGVHTPVAFHTERGSLDSEQSPDN
jgi:hypothetical protein